jgi:tetratricopeptide (TPR) repeat protein
MIMKNTSIKIIILFILSNCSCSMMVVGQKAKTAPPNSAKIQRLIAQQKKEIEADKDMDPAEKKKMLGLLNGASSKRINNAKTDAVSGQTANPLSEKARLAGISQKIFTDAEVGNLVAEMIKKLEPQIPASEKEFVNTAISKSRGNSVALSNMAVAAWYTGHAKAALMTALKAAALPHPEAALNNVAAILNLSGYEEKAVPVLRNLLSKYPNNSTVLNNLGQAFYGLGEDQKAKTCFLQCIKRSPNHPEACNTMAMMFLKAGRAQEAVDYLEQSLQGAYNASARNTLEEQRPDYDFIPIEENHFGRPADLPDLDIEIPELPYDVYHLNIIRSKHEKFRQRMSDIIADLDHKTSIESAKEPAEILAQATAGILNPFMGPGGELYSHYVLEGKAILLRKDSAVLAKINDARLKYEPEVAKIMKDNTGHYCEKLNALRSKRLNEASSIYKEFLTDYQQTARQYLEKELRTLPLIATCEAGYKAIYYRAISDYLSELRGLSIGAPFDVNCNGLPEVNTTDFKFDPNLQPACGYKVVIPFIIGSMKVDCSTFELEGGELLKLGLKRDFITNQTTLAIGVGVGIETPITELGAQQSFYISFDSDQQPTDIGMKGEVKSSVGAGITTESGLEYTMGMNSGIDVSATQGAQPFKL